ncbi:MAG TPA: hypothetical protein VHH72_06670 [Solirubrobacterales bacterium]|nr:hypothetical protein [Solirubrobacterales bacterium]
MSLLRRPARILAAARGNALGDVALDENIQLGPPIPITGDWRSSWGPSPPPGTPPPGAPRG